MQVSIPYSGSTAFLVWSGGVLEAKTAADARTAIGLGTTDSAQLQRVGLGGVAVSGYPLTCYQSQDSAGLRVYGYDDKSSEYVQFHLGQYGEGYCQSTGDLYLYAAASYLKLSTAGVLSNATWQGTAIADGYIASATNWNTAYGWGDHAGLYESSGAVATHSSDTTSVHGIADTSALLTDVVSDTTPQLGGDLDCNGNSIHFGAAENTQTPAGTTATIDLGAENHHTLDCGSASGDVTLTVTVPPGPTAGTIIVEQGATARDITWSPSAGTVKWLGTEPTWNGDASKWRIVSWRWDGTYLYLSATETD